PALHTRQSTPTLFPYTTLFRSDAAAAGAVSRALHRHIVLDEDRRARVGVALGRHLEVHHVARVVLHDEEHTSPAVGGFGGGGDLDRKSTRLNSSHVAISYAVFC